MFGGVFSCAILEQRPGFVVLQVSGKQAYQSFRHEAGGIRWQRVPPTERRGRVHTSTVTIAVMPPIKTVTTEILDSEIEWKAVVGSGPGGQHRNKTASAIQLKHKPTGIQVHVETERSQHMNLRIAKMLLAARLQESSEKSEERARNAFRKEQLGKGQRGDKRRTVALQRGTVVDHVLNRKIPAKDYLRGDLSKLLI